MKRLESRLPLLARSRLLGALVLASSHPSRRYRPQDFRLAQELAHRAALAIENARLYQAAQRAIQAREEVLSIVAHDLRNPIHASQFAATVLRQQLPEEGAEKARKSVETIVRSSKRAIHLIQDLLDGARIEAGHLSIEQDRVPAARILIDAVESQELLATSSSVELRLDLPRELPDVWADRERLLQVFENLIGNAFKFTAAGGSITVGAAAQGKEGLFWVSDTGAGIPAENLPHLFERFYQVRRADRRGAGLGLPTAKGIVEAHGGSG
jgi:signal transduction histidine kinase